MSNAQAFGMMLCFPLAGSLFAIVYMAIAGIREHLSPKKEDKGLLPHDYGKK